MTEKKLDRNPCRTRRIPKNTCIPWPSAAYIVCNLPYSCDANDASCPTGIPSCSDKTSPSPKL